MNGNPLISLEGIPKQITREIFIAKACGFTEEDIRKVCDVTEINLSFLVGERNLRELQKIRNRNY